VAWLCSDEAGAHRGEDVSLRDPEIRSRAGIG
jgi:hypothetical protein